MPDESILEKMNRDDRSYHVWQLNCAKSALTSLNAACATANFVGSPAAWLEREAWLAIEFSQKIRLDAQLESIARLAKALEPWLVLGESERLSANVDEGIRALALLTCRVGLLMEDRVLLREAAEWLGVCEDFCLKEEDPNEYAEVMYQSGNARFALAILEKSRKDLELAIIYWQHALPSFQSLSYLFKASATFSKPQLPFQSLSYDDWAISELEAELERAKSLLASFIRERHAGVARA